MAIEVLKPQIFRRDQNFAFKWTADASGNAELAEDKKIEVTGSTLHAFIHVPDADVTDDYDIAVPITIILPDGSQFEISNALSTDGADLTSPSYGTAVSLSMPFNIPYTGKIGLNISGAGANNSGVFILQLWNENQ